MITIRPSLLISIIVAPFALLLFLSDIVQAPSDAHGQHDFAAVLLFGIFHWIPFVIMAVAGIELIMLKKKLKSVYGMAIGIALLILHHLLLAPYF